MSEECQNDSNCCTEVKRTIVSVGVVAIVLLLVALFVMFLPVVREWRASAARAAHRAEVAAVHGAAGDAAFAAGLYEDASMDYVLASGVDSSDVSLTARLARARTAGIAMNPNLIDSVNLLDTRNDMMIVASLFPEDVTNVQVVKALIKFREGMANEAVTILEDAGKADPDSVAVHMAKAVLWQKVPERESSVAAEFDAVLAARPDDARIQGLAGDYFLNVGQVEKGIGLLRNASGRIRNLGWLKALTTFSLQSGDAENAIKDAQIALAMSPRDVEVLSLYGQALINSRKLDEAVRVLQQANSIRESRDTLLQLGVALNGMKDYGRALGVLAKVVQSGQDPISLFEYANALAGTNNAPEAMKIYNVILGIPDGAGTESENKTILSIKDNIKQRMAAMAPSAPAAK